MKIGRSLAAGGLALVLVGCVGFHKPVTPPPHAFISYRVPDPGDKSLRLGVKDLIDMKGEVTSAGSEYLSKHAKPAVRDAECLRFARRNGVTIVGKTNLSEFAIGVSGSNDYFGTPVNPLAPDRVPGGSSSGSASAVGFGLADVALGTDTAGSIRVPAACCGIAGLKTTFGLISIKGVYPISPNYLDTVGPMAKDVKGLVSGMELLQPNFASLYAHAREAHPTTKGIRIGLLRVPGTDPAISRAVEAALTRAGFQVVPLDKTFLKAWKKAQSNGNLVAAAASYYNNRTLQNEQGVRRRAKVAMSFGKLVFGWLFDSEEKRDAAIAERDAWRETLRRTFEHVDAIALPVLQHVPPRRNHILPGVFEGLFLGLQYTVAVNYAGVPALAIPIPLKGRAIPVTSLQLIGPPDSEAELLNIGRLVERSQQTR